MIIFTSDLDLLKKRKEQWAIVIPVRQIQSLISIVEQKMQPLWHIKLKG